MKIGRLFAYIKPPKLLLFNILIQRKLNMLPRLNSILSISSISILLLVLLSSCYVSQNLRIAKRISVKEDFTFNLKNVDANNYSSFFGIKILTRFYLNGLKQELTRSGFIITNDEPDYMLVINQVTVWETVRTQKINESDSPNYGEVFDVTSLSLNTEGYIEDMYSFEKYSWQAYKSRAEKLKCKEREDLDECGNVVNSYNTFTLTSLPINVMELLTTRLGRRAAVRTTKMTNELIKSTKRSSNFSKQ